MDATKKTTVPNPPVGADGEQPSQGRNNMIVPRAASESKKNLVVDEDARQIKKPPSLKSFTLNELFDMVFDDAPPIIDGLLYPGAHIFAGTQKIGKSFLMAQLAYHVSTGIDLWGYKVSRCDVLYLALEDGERRLQERLFRMFGAEGNDKLHFVTAGTETIQSGFIEQLNEFVGKWPDTRFVIVDVLQRVRDADGGKAGYAEDYVPISMLKSFADAHRLCLLIVHHTRKQQADDAFDMISGTIGLSGAADGSFVFRKAKRLGNGAALEITGRDQADQRLHLTRDMERLSWELERTETELWEEPPDEILDAVAALVTSEEPKWVGSATELAKRIDKGKDAKSLSRHLNVSRQRLLKEYQVHYDNRRKNTGSEITLTLRSET